MALIYNQMSEKALCYAWREYTSEEKDKAVIYHNIDCYKKAISIDTRTIIELVLIKFELKERCERMLDKIYINATNERLNDRVNEIFKQAYRYNGTIKNNLQPSKKNCKKKQATQYNKLSSESIISNESYTVTFSKYNFFHNKEVYVKGKLNNILIKRKDGAIQ